MNNTCPSCGAVYNVAQKDIGRRLKCKKCGTALTVTDAGLEADVEAVAAVPAAAAADDAYEEEAPPPRSRRGASRSASTGGGLDPIQMFSDFGGVWSILFGLGAFLVIVFMFMPLIGVAKVTMRQGDIRAAQQDWIKREKQLEKESRSSDVPKEKEKFDKRMEELDDRVKAAQIGNQQSGYLDRYFMMFGFILLMFGSLGYVMPGPSTTRRVVGAIVLCAQVVFMLIYVIIVSGVASFTTGG
jgi:predicted Zn finger-like uncharacterized protein